MHIKESPAKSAWMLVLPADSGVIRRRRTGSNGRHRVSWSLRRKARQKLCFSMDSTDALCCTAVPAVLATASILQGPMSQEPGLFVMPREIGIPLEFQRFAPSLREGIKLADVE
jgi:hypothetical protein